MRKNSNIRCDLGKSIIHVKNSSGGFCKISNRGKIVFTTEKVVCVIDMKNSVIPQDVLHTKRRASRNAIQDSDSMGNTYSIS